MELVIISGKGGTGKTTIAVALSELAVKTVKADCDVDAPNLYLLYKGEDIERNDFIGGKKAVLSRELCTECGICENYCKFGVIKENRIDPIKCEGCGACTLVCPQKAITLIEEKSANVIVTKSRNGIISRAEMDIGSEGSGKLVTEVRKKAKEYCREEYAIIIDGSPGVGCSVIASITGCNMALAVTEPTKSGLEDLKRVIDVCKYFRVLPLICINKYDINPAIAEEIEDYCLINNITVVGKIPYDDTIMRSINELRPITDYKNSSANKAVGQMWMEIKNYLK